MTRVKAYLLTAAAAALLLPISGARAQGNAPTADDLVRRAQALYETPAMYGVAATLYRRSASLRSPSDAAAVQALMMAGRLYTYAGEAGRGQAAMEEAGELALQNGDALAAARAYTDAAFIAASQHSRRTADLVRRVIWLANSPLIPAEQGQRLRDRVAPKGVALSLATAGESATD